MDFTRSQKDSGLTDSTMLKSHLVLSGWVVYTMKKDLSLFCFFFLVPKMCNNIIWTYYIVSTIKEGMFSFCLYVQPV